jgi:flagellar assembly protein FliH
VVIPKEQSHGFQRWEMVSLNKNQAPSAVTPTEPASVVTPTDTSSAGDEALQQAILQLPTAEDIERIYEEARQSGYAAGLAEGKAEHEAAAAQTNEAQFAHFAALIKNLQDELSSIDQTVADQLLLLAIEIAGQVCRGSISTKEDYLLPIIREAITTLPIHHAHLTLRLNPTDAHNVRLHLGEQFAQTGTQIIEDNTIIAGGCQLLAGASEVDATIETRWKRVLEAIGTEPQAWLKN